MPDGVVTNLGLIAGVGLYSNVGLQPNAVTAASTAGYRTLNLGNLLYTINKAATDPGLGISAGTLANLQSIGANVSGNYCPSLGDSIPSNVSIATANVGLTGLMLDNANVYLGSGNYRVFAQAFQTALGFATVTNQIILSNCNSSDYLGPTFGNMEELISGDIARVTLAYDAFGSDLQKTGNLLDFEDLDLLGTPAGLIQQISDQGNMINGTTPALRDALLAQGLTDDDIADLVNDNRQSLFNPQGLSENEFNRLQKQAYPALVSLTGADLDDLLNILGVTTPNIDNLAQLLDPKKIFPTSFPSLTLNDVLIYEPDGTVNGQVEAILNGGGGGGGGGLVPKGCEDLSKIIPPDQAVANRALQISFGQINSINLIDGAQLARILT